MTLGLLPKKSIQLGLLPKNPFAWQDPIPQLGDNKSKDFDFNCGIFNYSNDVHQYNDRKQASRQDGWSRNGSLLLLCGVIVNIIHLPDQTPAYSVHHGGATIRTFEHLVLGLHKILYIGNIFQFDTFILLEIFTTTA